MVASLFGGPDKQSVVIVEDDAAVRKALAFAFSTHDIPVRCYGCAEDLLAVDNLADVCYLILDYRLPAMNGLELLKELQSRGADAPAVIIATNPSVAVRAAAASQGATMVEKPLLDESLYELVLKRAIGQRAPGV
jgi:FixJ family two-component response regulator